MKKTNKIVCEVGLIVSWVQLFGQSKKRLGVVMKVINLENSLCIR